MRKTSENERKLINRLLDIDENEGFVLLAMCFLETSEMKDDALLYLEQNPKCSKKMFLKKAAEIKIERLKSNIKKYKKRIINDYDEDLERPKNGIWEIDYIK